MESRCGGGCDGVSIRRLRESSRSRGVRSLRRGTLRTQAVNQARYFLCCRRSPQRKTTRTVAGRSRADIKRASRGTRGCNRDRRLAFAACNMVREYSNSNLAKREELRLDINGEKRSLSDACESHADRVSGAFLRTSLIRRAIFPFRTMRWRCSNLALEVAKLSLRCLTSFYHFHF